MLDLLCFNLKILQLIDQPLLIGLQSYKLPQKRSVIPPFSPMVVMTWIVTKHKKYIMD